jgi:hypothetical protein
MSKQQHNYELCGCAKLRRKSDMRQLPRREINRLFFVVLPFTLFFVIRYFYMAQPERCFRSLVAAMSNKDYERIKSLSTSRGLEGLWRLTGERHSDLAAHLKALAAEAAELRNKKRVQW